MALSSVSSILKHSCRKTLTIPSMFPLGYKYLGLIKNQPHYINEYNEVYMHEHSEKLEYVADWLDDYKMLWTDNPEIYRLVTINNQNYFYDIEFKDAYKYDKVSGLVIPQGFIFNIK